MNLFAKIINDYKGGFPQVVTGDRDEFRILKNICDGIFVFL